jgi:hypothetical protein
MKPSALLLFLSAFFLLSMVFLLHVLREWREGGRAVTTEAKGLDGGPDRRLAQLG